MDATTASIRFGLGPRPGELAVIGEDPRAWLIEQLRGDQGPRMPSRSEVVARLVKAHRRHDKEAFKVDLARTQHPCLEAQGGTFCFDETWARSQPP